MIYLVPGQSLLLNPLNKMKTQVSLRQLMLFSNTVRWCHQVSAALKLLVLQKDRVAHRSNHALVETNPGVKSTSSTQDKIQLLTDIMGSQGLSVSYCGQSGTPSLTGC